MARKRCTLKVVVIGESEVGKTSLLLRMTEKKFFSELKRTAGVELKRINMTIGNVDVTLNVFDTVGQDRFRAVSRNYYRGADAALLVYDVNHRYTLEALDYWSNELDHFSDNPRVIKVLVGNKLDLVAPDGQPKVPLELSSKWADGRSMGCSLQTSAKSGHNVANAFEAVIRLTTKFQDVEYGANPALALNGPFRPRASDGGHDESRGCC
ncbi:Ras-related protein Rab-14 [Halotydeus destructor]|nr:Ras-related protein Rab-14 [Halotydeus destructor]